jgi:glucokinase
MAYQNQSYSTFTSIIHKFLLEANTSKNPVSAVIAVAGPVRNNRVCFTNISWSIDGSSIAAELGIQSVLLINDFVAQGYGVLTLDESIECLVLQSAPKLTAPIVCIGPGTGLGQCFLTPIDDQGSYRCFPSEGGHAEFAPRNEVSTKVPIIKNVTLILARLRFVYYFSKICAIITRRMYTYTTLMSLI